MLESSIYEGNLFHRRLTPAVHEFRYPIYWAYLDIDQLPQLFAKFRVASYNRFNWASFADRDHFGDPGLSIRKRLDRDAESHGLKLPTGKIFLMTQLRYLGYVFNPISFFYCYNREGKLEMVLSEVNNTFGETHNYWLHEGCRIPTVGGFRYRTGKAFHVSPFLPMELGYEFNFTDPAEATTVHIGVSESGQPKFDASMTLTRKDWNEANLLRSLIRFPFTTLMVVWRIHWQAAKLLWKRVPVFDHPARRQA